MAENRILIVEDETSIAELERKLLTMAGFEVERCENGSEALQKLEVNSYDLLLLDYQLPDMTGADIIKRLGARIASLPVVMVTGRGDEQLAVELLRSGVADYLVKSTPNFVHVLPAIVRSAIDKFAHAAEKRQLEDQLRRREETFRRTFQAIPDPAMLWVRNDKGIVLSQANRAALHLSGKLSADAGNVELESFFKGSPEVIGMIKAAISEDRSQSLELTGAIFSDELRWYHVDCNQFKDEGALIIFKDITERKTAEEQLRKAHNELEQRVQERTAELTEANQQLKDDITERNQLETQLRHAQKMESIGTLASGIAHEINTPTQFVGDNLHFLRDSFEDLDELFQRISELMESIDGDSADETMQNLLAAYKNADIDYLKEEVPKAIAQSLDGVQRVAKIVGAMKAFAHPGAEEKTAVDINIAIENTVTVARNEWKYVSDLETDFADDLPLVNCNVGEFNGVILNMIVNASHAIADVVGDGSGGKGKIKVSTRRDGEMVAVTISDTGKGIPPEIRGRIFDPFFTTKEVGKGTGQGLAIAHSVIVDKHEGTIDVESEVGKGTRFVIRLPVSG